MGQRPRLLDLFCGAGGAGMGYSRAGFDVVGVDLESQPDYPFEFYQADALAFPLDGFDAVHASPPCQSYSSLSALPTTPEYPRLIRPVIARLRAYGRPWVVENVAGARVDFPADAYRFQLCASSFGLRMYRHRWFASDVFVPALACQHAQVGVVVGVYGHSDGEHPRPRRDSRGHSRGPRQATTIEAREAMGMPWATARRGITEAIPPAYTEYVGSFLIRALGQ